MNKKKKPRIRFKGFTDDWEQRKLYEVAEIIGGGTPSTNNSDYWDGDIDWYTPAEIGDKTFASGSIRKITEEGLKNSSAKILPANKTVLFTSRAGIGNMAILQHAGATNQGFQSLICNNDIDPYFIFSMGNMIQHEAERVAAGSTFAEISGKSLGKLSFLMPKWGEQRKLGKFFQQMDNLITLHQRKCEKLKIIKKSMLENCFPKNGQKVPKIRFSGFTGDWEQRKLIDLLDEPITDGPHETPMIMDSGIPFISADAIVNNKIDFSKKRGYITEEYNSQCSKKYTPELYDVYLVKSGSTVGKVAIVETTAIFNIWSPLAAMRCRKKTNPYFLYFLLQTQENQNQVKEKASNGTQPNLSMRILEKFDLNVPAQSLEQDRIGAFFRHIDSDITLHQSKLEKLKKIKKSMLERMFV